jgi:hypothetical protein
MASVAVRWQEKKARIRGTIKLETIEGDKLTSFGRRISNVSIRPSEACVSLWQFDTNFFHWRGLAEDLGKLFFSYFRRQVANIDGIFSRGRLTDRLGWRRGRGSRLDGSWVGHVSFGGWRGWLISLELGERALIFKLLQGVEEKPTSLSFTDTCTTKIFKRWSRS